MSPVAEPSWPPPTCRWRIWLRKCRAAILRAGVEPNEWGPACGSRLLRDLLAGDTLLRLHAKAAVIGRRLVFMGSMNFDPRSRDLNTEFGLLIRSPELAQQMHALIERLKHEGSHRLHLDMEGGTLHWTAGDSDVHAREFEPGSAAGSRPLLRLPEPLLPTGDALGPGAADGMIAPRDKSEFAFQIKHLA